MENPFQAIGQIGSSAIEASAQENMANQQAQDAANLEASEFGQEVNYIGKEQEAARGAYTGIGEQGNPYMQARADVPGPTFASGGTFGPGGSGPSTPVQLPNQVQNPIPQGPGYSGVVQGLTGVTQGGKQPSMSGDPLMQGLTGGVPSQQYVQSHA